MATTWYGGTAGEVLVDETGRAFAGLKVDLYTDTLFTTAVTGLINEAGTVVGGTVTAGTAGRVRFGDPSGGTRVFYSPARYITVAGVPQPDPSGGYFQWRPELVAGTGAVFAYAFGNVNYPRPGGPLNPQQVIWVVTPGVFPNQFLSGVDGFADGTQAPGEPTLLSGSHYLAQGRYRMLGQTGMAEGDPVLNIVDATGTLNLPSVSGLRPIWRAATSNRGPCMEFGNGSSLSRLVSATIGPFNQPGWLAAHVMFTSVDTSTHAIFGPLGNVAGWGIQQVGNTAGNPSVGMKSATVPKSSATFAANTWYTLFAVYSPTGPNSKFYVNGVLDTTVGSPGSSQLSQLVVGGQSNSGGAQQLKALVAEMSWGVTDDADYLPNSGYISAWSAFCASNWHT